MFCRAVGSSKMQISILVVSLIVTQRARQATSSATSLKVTWDKISSKQSQTIPATSDKTRSKLSSSHALTSTTQISSATQTTQKNWSTSTLSSSSTTQSILSAHEASLSTEISTTQVKHTSRATDTSVSTAAKSQTFSLHQRSTTATTRDQQRVISTFKTRLSSLVNRKESKKPTTRTKPTTSSFQVPQTKTTTSRLFIPPTKTNPTTSSFYIRTTTRSNHQQKRKETTDKPTTSFGKWEIFGFCCLGIVIVLGIFGIIICSVRFRSNHKAEELIRMRLKNAQMHHQKHGHRPFTALPSSGTNEPPKIKENPYEMIGIIRSARSDDSLRIMAEMDLNTRSKDSKDSNKTLGDSASNTLESPTRSLKPPPTLPDQISALKEENAPVFSVSERSSSLMEASSPDSFSPDGENKQPADRKDKRKPNKLHPEPQQARQLIKEKHRSDTDRVAPKHKTRLQVNQPVKTVTVKETEKSSAVPLSTPPLSPPVRSPYSQPIKTRYSPPAQRPDSSPVRRPDSPPVRHPDSPHVRHPDSPPKEAGPKLKPSPTANIIKKSAHFHKEKPSTTKTIVEPKEISVDETSEESSWSIEDKNEKKY